MNVKDHRDVRFAATDGSFRFGHVRYEHPNPQDFAPHYETDYEIYMFISGEGSFTIEGSRYELEPYSVLLLNSNELHVVNISDQSPYERIVLTFGEKLLPPFLADGIDFFRAMKRRDPGRDNRIEASDVVESGLLGLFEKLTQLLAERSPGCEFVAKCIIVQMLWTIHRLAERKQSSPARKDHPKIGEVLEYVNARLDQELDLDSLAGTFFINKYHLCRLFKEVTGYTINQYIVYKRVRLADELMRSGHPPTQACFMSGFKSYSNFFRSYRKLTCRSPKEARIR
ncbi:AraC family transcriptional regulator [Paenibacillus sp. TRM 82003]|nr:AraC family transcriptional regulator [Paenibacillus sp. TRM 82003]